MIVTNADKKGNTKHIKTTKQVRRILKTGEPTFIRQQII